MGNALYYIILLIALGGVGLAIWRFGMPMITGDATPRALFGNKSDRRLEVVEHASVDNRRRLVIVRRDNVEHLIMTGGPVDVVIETGIGELKVKSPQLADPPKAVFSRQPRNLGQATSSEN